MKTLSIGGLGGFELGLRNAGLAIEPWGFCERERRAREVLRREWPAATQFREITDIIVSSKSNGWQGHVKRRGLDIISGKLRVSDVVVAQRGKRVAPGPGLGQWIARLSREVQPLAVLLEIESEILQADDGRRMQTLLAHFAGWVPEIPPDGWRSGGFITPNPDLGEYAFGGAWRVLDLAAFGSSAVRVGDYLPQCRERLYLCLQRGTAPACEVLLDESDLVGIPASIGEAGTDGRSEFQADDAGVDVGSGGFAWRKVIPFVWRAGGFMQAPIVPRDTLPAISGDNVALANEVAGAVRRLTPEEVELAFTFPNAWTATGVQNRAKGLRTVAITDTPRYRMLGRDAVPPAIVEWIGSRFDAIKV